MLWANLNYSVIACHNLEQGPSCFRRLSALHADMFRIQVVAYQWRHFQRTFQGRERLSSSCNSGDLRFVKRRCLFSHILGMSHIFLNYFGELLKYGIKFPWFQHYFHQNSPEFIRIHQNYIFGMMSPTPSFWSLMLDTTLSCSVKLSSFKQHKNSRTQLIADGYSI